MGTKQQKKNLGSLKGTVQLLLFHLEMLLHLDYANFVFTPVKNNEKSQ